MRTAFCFFTWLVVTLVVVFQLSRLFLLCALLRMCVLFHN